MTGAGELFFPQLQLWGRSEVGQLFDRGKISGSVSYFSVAKVSGRPHCAHQHGLCRVVYATPPTNLPYY